LGVCLPNPKPLIVIELKQQLLDAAHAC